MRPVIKSVAAFLYGFLGSVIFTTPVLWLLSFNALDPALVFSVTLAFTIGWTYLWVWFGNKHHFYDHHMVPYVVGSAVGFVLVLDFAAVFDGVLGGLFNFGVFLPW